MLKSILPHSVELVLQDAVHEELRASHLYKHVANQLQRMGYFGAQKHFDDASAEELTHYAKHREFLNDCGVFARIPALNAVSDEIESLRDAVQLAYDTELELKQKYDRWYLACASQPSVQQHLLFFLAEQVESVGKYGDLLAMLDRAGDNAAAILMVDAKMGGQ